MSVRIRMTRMGRRHRPFYRINAVDSKTPRDGRILEKIGHYDPIEKDEAKQVVIDVEKAKAWIEKGSEPLDTVARLLKLGISCSSYEAKLARREHCKKLARKAGKPFTKAEKMAVEKAREEARVAAAEAAKKAAAEAAAAAKAAEEAAKAAAKAAEEAAKAKAAEAQGDAS